MPDFFRRELPAIAADKGTQLARTRELHQRRNNQLDEARNEGWEDGLRHSRLEADAVVKAIQERMDKMWSQLVDIKAKAAKERAEAAAFRRKVDHDKRQKTIQHFFCNPLQHDVRLRSEPEKLGEGYTARNISSGLFAHHVKAVEMQIVTMAKDDPLKQLQLAAAVSHRMQGIRSLRDRDHEAWGYVRNSLKAFFETLQDRYNGRYPNDIRAAQQAVCAAIANAAPPRKLSVISTELGISVERLAEGRKHWSDWVAGGRESIMDLRGKARSDGMKEEWIEFAVDTWLKSTRRSERAKDNVRNPNDKNDTKLYRIHWLEVVSRGENP